jgi:hypothetical protein
MIMGLFSVSFGEPTAAAFNAGFQCTSSQERELRKGVEEGPQPVSIPTSQGNTRARRFGGKEPGVGSSVSGGVEPMQGEGRERHLTD